MRDLELKEKISYGTKERPMGVLHFEIGPGKEEGEHLLVPNHWHEYTEIILIRKGTYQFRINLEQELLREGDICFFNSGDLHQLTNLDTETCHDAILFHPLILDFSYSDQWSQEVIGPLMNQKLLMANVLHPADPGYPKLRQLTEELFDLAFEKNTFWYERCKVKILEILLEMNERNLLFQASAVRNSTEQIQIRRYKTIVDYIKDHYRENISLENLAELIPCNSQYLCRLFKQISGDTPIQYLIHYRIERAEELLKETNRTVSEVAMDCGFDNISYFIRKFKEIQGMTPGEYRGNHHV